MSEESDWQLLTSTEQGAERKAKKKKVVNILVEHGTREWKEIDLLCVTAVGNRNEELKVGVLPVALHVLFPPFHRLPFFTACCLKDGLPRSTMKKG